MTSTGNDTDFRADRAAQAQAAAARNRPKTIVYAAGLLLAVGLLLLILADRQRAEALDALSLQRQQTSNVFKLIDDVRKLRARQAAMPALKIERREDVRQAIRDAAPDALRPKVPIPKENLTSIEKLADKNAQRMVLRYEQVNHESLEDLTTWVGRALERVPGLEVYSISVKPQQNVWTMTVHFSRWEKIAGSNP